MTRKSCALTLIILVERLASIRSLFELFKLKFDGTNNVRICDVMRHALYDNSQSVGIAKTKL